MAVAVLLPICTGSVNAFDPVLRDCLTGQYVEMGWAPDQQPIPYYINPNQYPGLPWDPGFDLVHAAFRTWEQATWGKVRFSYQGTTPRGWDRGDGQSTISFGANLQGGEFAQTCVVMSAETFVVNGRTLHKILEADIRFSADQPALFRWASPGVVGHPYCPDAVPPRVDIQSIATHEIGHLIGLAHTQQQHREATMYYPGNTCDLSYATLEADDIAGARSIYPPPGNAALRRDYSIATTSTFTATEHSGGEITDGSLAYTASVTDGCAGWQITGSGLFEVRITIQLGEFCRVTKVRYNMGDVQRADTWNADRFISPFGDTPTNPGTPYAGAWTEHSGSLATSSVEVTLQKTKTSPVTDWLFVGEIECIAEPVSGFAVVVSSVLGPNNVRADPLAALGPPDGRPVSLGVGGEITIDLGEYVSQHSIGPNLVIHEAADEATTTGVNLLTAEVDTLPEGYALYGRDDGPWTLLGNGVGTQAFQMQLGPSSCYLRYLRIVDDGDGDPNSLLPGVEVDGISLIDSSVVDPFPVQQLAGLAGNPGPLLSPTWTISGPLYFSGPQQASPYGPWINFIPATGGPITSTGWRGFDPAISPSGSLLAFFAYNGTTATRDLAVVPFIGVRLRDVPRPRSPAWSPDGAFIAFHQSGRGYTSGIYTIGSTSGAPVLLAPSGTAGDLRWSPTGDRIAFAESLGTTWEGLCGTLPRPTYRLVIISYPAGVVLNTIQVHGRSTSAPSWSPDGQYLACAVDGPAEFLGHYESTIWRVKADDAADAQQISVGPTDTSPAWAPSGQVIAFNRFPGLSVFQATDTDRSFGTAVDAAATVPSSVLILRQNYPNPFNPTTTIRFAIPSRARVVLTIYNVAGKRVVELLDSVLPVGWHETTWNGRDAANRPGPSGVYFYRIRAAGQAQTRRMVLLH